MIPFNKHAVTGAEIQLVTEAISCENIAGNGHFTKECERWFEDKLNCHRALLTPSCTSALEMAAILIDIQPGDEVIMPSYTFVSTANAFVLHGAKIVFVDIRPDTMNIDETLIEAAITQKTKVIVPVHYAGVACEMDTIMDIAERNNLYVVEDAAQGMMATYKGRPLGTIGHLGAYSFHATKNYTSGGEGGLLIVNDQKFVERAEIIREKGTNRTSFFKGMVDKYTWVDIGSSYLMNEVSAAYLYAQLENAEIINSDRARAWMFYYKELYSLQKQGYIKLPHLWGDVDCNYHMFFIKVDSIEIRTALMRFLKDLGVCASYHYIPLHSSKAGFKHGDFFGDDVYTTVESERLLRLPLYYKIEPHDLNFVVNKVHEFFK